MLLPFTITARFEMRERKYKKKKRCRKSSVSASTLIALKSYLTVQLPRIHFMCIKIVQMLDVEFISKENWNTVSFEHISKTRSKKRNSFSFFSFFFVVAQHKLYIHSTLYKKYEMYIFKTRHRIEKRKTRKYTLRETCRGVTKNKSICFHFVYLFKYMRSSSSRSVLFQYKKIECTPINFWKLRLISYIEKVLKSSERKSL